MKSEVAFGDEKLKEEFKNIDDEKFRKHLERAFDNLKEDAFCGIQIPKHLIPKEYGKRYGLLTNLWKYNLPDA